MSESNEVLDSIHVKIQRILNSSFTNSYRKKIDVYPDRWNFCCPVCGDSVNDNRKKRGNLYLNSLSYHCYNCGCHYGINSFLKRFDEELSDVERCKVYDIQQNAKKFEKRYNTSSKSSSILYTLIDKLAIPKTIFFKVNKLVSPYKVKHPSDYLHYRKIGIKDWRYFAYKESTKELYILNLNQNDRVIGYQIRQLDSKSKKPRYLTRSLSKIYYEMFGKDLNGVVERLLGEMSNGQVYIEQEDGIENIVVNIDKLSGLFNVMNVDMRKPLTIVEGPIDSLGIDNCIALQGATKMNNYFDDIEDVRYLFDNDDVGKKHSITKLKEHKNVFLWDKYLKLIKSYDKVKDINDLMRLDKFKNDVFDKCFSNNELDIIMI